MVLEVKELVDIFFFTESARSYVSVGSIGKDLFTYRINIWRVRFGRKIKSVPGDQ